MDAARQRAYRTLLSVGLQHLKWDLACWYGGLSWLRPLRAIRECQQAERAAYRSAAFHNLAIIAEAGFEGFSEERFWQDIDSFHQRFPDDPHRYREMFDILVRGDPVVW